MEKITQKDFRETTEIKLPTSGITVAIYPCLVIGDILNMKSKEGESERMVEVLVKVIKEWNFYENESDESPLEINTLNVCRLPVPDITMIYEQISKLSDAEKKN